MSTSTTLPDVSPCVPCNVSHHRLFNSSFQGVWSEEEHDRFLEAMRLFPKGPWKDITAHVGTRSVRQVQTHAQKYCEKLERRTRGLQKERKRLLRPEHRLDHASDSYVGGITSGSVFPNASAFPVRVITADADTCKSKQFEQDFRRERGPTANKSDNESAQERCESPGDDANEGVFSMADLDEQCLAYLACVLGVDNEGDL